MDTPTRTSVASLLAAFAIFLIIALLAAYMFFVRGADTHSRAPDPVPTTSVVLLVRGLRSDSGVMRGAAYVSREDWLEPGRATSACRARIEDGQARCELVVPVGAHVAFTATHDEDDDAHFDRDLLNFPLEGYAFSNGSTGPLAPPPFAHARVAPAQSCVLTVRYDA